MESSGLSMALAIVKPTVILAAALTPSGVWSTVTPLTELEAQPPSSTVSTVTLGSATDRQHHRSPIPGGGSAVPEKVWRTHRAGCGNLVRKGICCTQPG